MIISTEEQAYYQGYLVELKKVYFSGASRVKYRERDTTFRSMAEMSALIKELEEALVPPTAATSGAAFAEYGSGL